MLTQDNRFFKVWNAANFLGVIFYLLEIGLLLAFGQDFWEDELQYLIVINVIFFVLFACDILLCPLKSYYHNGIMIVNRGAIFKRYVRWRIYTDSLALLGLVIPYLGKLSTLNVFKVFFFLKIPSALTIDKELLIQVRSKSRSNHVYAIARLVFIALLWAHYLGIFFFVIDLAIYNSNYYGPNTPSYCWVYNSPTEYAFIVNHRWYIQYLYSLYFSVGNVTTIAYGDIIPLNPAETVYINVCMILSVLLFTYIFKSILEAIIISRQDKFDHDYNLNLVANILKDNSISSTTAQKVKSFLEIKWSEERHRNDEVEGRMIGYLPKYLKEELLLTVHGVMLKEIGIIHPGREFLASENRSLFMYHLLQCITSEKHFVGQHLFDEGESF